MRPCFALCSTRALTSALTGGQRWATTHGRQQRAAMCAATMKGDAGKNGAGEAEEERFDVLNEDGSHKGFSKARSLVHRDGDWHRSTHIWVLNARGQVLVQRRAAGKDTFPVRWGVFAAA